MKVALFHPSRIAAEATALCRSFRAASTFANTATRQRSCAHFIIWRGRGASPFTEQHAHPDRVSLHQRGPCPLTCFVQASITHLVTSNDDAHAAIITDLDKSVHLFSIPNLQQIDTHVLPKRPCALTFTPDASFILSGDKFGDVYALPPEANELQGRRPQLGGSRRTKRRRLNGIGEPFKPSATELTVHSERNRRALENQRRQAEADAAARSKEVEQDGETALGYDPILGHVSMLLDLVTIRVPAPVTGGGHGGRHYRDYLFTSDRDEHIRISRGPPQAHIIEGFCQGHRSFVSKLCIVEQDTLISGGGDDFLCVWDWQRSQLLTKLDLRRRLEQSQALEKGQPIVVSGIWALPDPDDKKVQVRFSFLLFPLSRCYTVFAGCHSPRLTLYARSILIFLLASRGWQPCFDSPIVPDEGGL